MDRLEAEEGLVVTHDDRPLGEPVPIAGPRESVPTAELMAAFAHRPHVDYQKLRTEMDELFGDDDAVD